MNSKDNELEPFGFLTNKTKKPAKWIGGGAYSNTCVGQWVLDKNKNLKKCIYVQRSGHLACSVNQGIVALSEGDYWCSFDGRRDEVGNSEISSPKCMQIEKIKIIEDQPHVKLKEADLSWEDMPESVIEGLNTYHNRDAEYFCE